MSRLATTRVYDLYSRFYDGFGVLFRRRLARAISAVPFSPGDRVLDVGVGTGLSLEFYPLFVQLTGIDLSAGMLGQAQRKLERGVIARPPQSTRLIRADAQALPFGERSFEVVFLSHMISTVPDAGKCLAEAIRVAAEYSYIVIVNHFRSEVPVVSWVESALDPVCRRLGWRSDLSLVELLAGAGVENARDLRRDKGRGMIFKTVFLQKRGAILRVVPMPVAGVRPGRLRTA